MTEVKAFERVRRLKERLKLEEVATKVLFKPGVDKCITFDFQPKSAFWQKNFKIKEDGAVFSYLMLNGLLVRDAKLKVWDFDMLYLRRITGRSFKKLRACQDYLVRKYKGVEPYLFVGALFELGGQIKIDRSEKRVPGILEPLIPQSEKYAFLIKCTYFDSVILPFFNEIRKKSYEVLGVDVVPERLSTFELFQIFNTGNFYLYPISLLDKFSLAVATRLYYTRRKVEGVKRNLYGKMLYLLSPYYTEADIAIAFDKGVKLFDKIQELNYIK